MSRWERFVEAPLSFVAPRQLAACLGDAPAELREQVLAQPRFRARLLVLLLARHQLQPLSEITVPDATTMSVLELSPLAFSRLPRLCGAIWHAATLAREVRAPAQQALRQALGSELYSQALAHRELAGAADLLREPAALVQAIDQDGAACVAAWAQAQPAPLQRWLALRLSLPAAQPARPPVNLAIVEAAAAALHSLEEHPA